jgi:multiple sugar transport system permease protein
VKKPSSGIRHNQATPTTYVLLILITVIVVFPVFWMGSVSLRENTEVFTVPPTLFPPEATTKAYSSVLSNPDYLGFFFNSYIIAFTVSIASVAVGTVAAYGFSRFKFRGSRFITLFVVTTQMIPPITLLIPYFAIIVFVGLYDTRFGLIVTYMSFTLPYSVLMMTGYMNTISSELDEAAIVDGCSRFGALVRVVLPPAIPGIISTAVYAFILSWNEFIFAVALTRTTEMRTLPVGISLLMGEHAYQWNEIMALSVIATVPVLVLFVLIQRYYLAGLTSGSVKG